MKKLLICAFFALTLAGQNFQHVRLYKVKRDRMAEWQSAIQDLMAIYKKANVDAPTAVYQSLTGPEQFAIVRRYDKISQAVASRADAFKGNFEAEYRAANIRLMATVEDRETRVTEIKPELSIRDSTVPAPYLRVARVRVKPGRQDEMRAVLKEMMSAGMKPAGVKLYLVTETRMGGPVGEFTTSLAVPALTDLDESAARKAMGEVKYASWAAKRDAVTESAEVNLYRYRPELSNWNPKP
ncbi:MAG: hypothetical protein JNM66_02105 [Bryobacterales bacterium]|nr:hypothetical protein [Bryobacterales bacterium]